MLPPLRAGWGLRGEALEVPISGRNARRVIFGTLSLRTGHRILLPRERQRAGDFQASLRHVHSRYRGWPVAMLLDEDASHTAKGSVGLAEELGIEFLWLPKRAPELNPIEGLWGEGKDVVCSGHQYDTIDEQAERFVAYLTGLSKDETLEKAGIHSQEFWLAHPVFRGATRSSTNDASNALPRFLTLCTNSKNPRYNGSLSCEIPRWGRSHDRSSDQNPSTVLTCTSQKPSPSSSRANSPAAWQTVRCV
jgi:hypothetical protein